MQCCSSSSSGVCKTMKIIVIICAALPALMSLILLIVSIKNYISPSLEQSDPLPVLIPALVASITVLIFTNVKKNVMRCGMGACMPSSCCPMPMDCCSADCCKEFHPMGEGK